MGLTLTVLGCDGGFPGPGGAASGYLVQGAGTTIWMDAGPGTLANLSRHLSLDALDAVVLSHEHPDHRGDVEGLTVALSHPGWRRDAASADESHPRLPVYAPAGLLSHVYHRDSPDMAWTDVDDGDRISVGRLGVTFSRTDHGPPTLAVRIDGDGASLGYSADTGPGWSIEALGAGLDLALCEATYCADQEGRNQHMSARQAASSALDAQARQLVVTHRWPTVASEDIFEEASSVWGRPVDQARIGRVWEVVGVGSGVSATAGSAAEGAATGGSAAGGRAP